MPVNHLQIEGLSRWAKLTMETNEQWSTEWTVAKNLLELIEDYRLVIAESRKWGVERDRKAFTDETEGR